MEIDWTAQGCICLYLYDTATRAVSTVPPGSTFDLNRILIGSPLPVKSGETPVSCRKVLLMTMPEARTAAEAAGTQVHELFFKHLKYF